MTQDLSGRWFGKMEIIGRAGPEHGVLPPVAGGWWVGRCQCGREMVAPAEGFLSRRITSCGRPSPEDTAAEAERLAARRPLARI